MLQYYNQKKVKEAEMAEQTKLAEGRVEVLNKFAEYAAELLESEYPGTWTREEQAKLAVALIERAVQEDSEAEVMDAKIAELQQAGTIMADAFCDRWFDRLAQAEQK